MKVAEKYFEEVSLPNFIMIGAIIRTNIGNGRYKLHRIVEIFPWMLGIETIRATIVTVELDKYFQPLREYKPDGFIKTQTWSETKLIEAMALTRLEETPYGIKVTRALLWEHDALQQFVEIWYTHLN